MEKMKMGIIAFVELIIIIALSVFCILSFVDNTRLEKETTTSYKQGQIDCQKGIIKYKMKLDTTWQEVTK